MFRSGPRLVFVLTLLLTLVAAADKAISQTFAVKIDEVFAPLNNPNTPGASVVVIQDATVLFKKSYGAANIKTGSLIDTDSAFHLASVGKEMTAVAVMMLSAEGKLRIDDYVSKYLPQLRGWGSRIRIRHLLHHTSGMPDYYDDIENTYRRPKNSQALTYLSNIAHLDFRPGSQFDYSNSGYDTLATLVQKVSGQKFADFMNEHIFAPANMSNTFAFDAARRKSAKRALGYGLDHGEYYLDDTNALNDIHGSGSIYSTIDDMAKYDTALFNNFYLKKEIQDQAFTSDKLNNGTKTDYGFGWDILVDDNLNQPYYGHSGEWMGFASYYLHYPGKKLSVIILSNCSKTDAEGLAFATSAIFAPTLNQ